MGSGILRGLGRNVHFSFRKLTKNMIKKIFYSTIFLLSFNYFVFPQAKVISRVALDKFVEPKLFTEKTVFKNVSEELLTEDFDAFFYFFSTSYIGYDEIVANGFVSDGFILNIKNNIKTGHIKSSDDLIKNIYDELKNYICDTHFAIANGNAVYQFNHKFYEKTPVHSADFYMTINKNSVYMNLPRFLPDYFPENTSTKDFFQKVYSHFKVIQNKNYLIIDLRNCPGGLTDYPLLLLYSLYEGGDVIIPSKIFDARQLQAEIIYKRTRFIETPVTESLRYQRAVYTGNSGYEDDYKTASIMQMSNPKRIVRIENVKINHKIHKPAYNGKIIFLTNNKTASAAESIILQSKVLFPGKVKVLGQNTSGCLTYIDVFLFSMPNNSFAVSMAFKSIEESLKEFECWKGEGNGIEPDMICSDDEIIFSLKKITKDKKLRLKND